jgi:hypothetical protein
MADALETRGSGSASYVGVHLTHGHLGDLPLCQAEPLADLVLVAAEGSEEPDVLDVGSG